MAITHCDVDMQDKIGKLPVIDQIDQQLGGEVKTLEQKSKAYEFYMKAFASDVHAYTTTFKD